MNQTPQADPPVRILVVDDHSIVRHGLAALLQREPDLRVCAEAADYDEAMAALKAQQPDFMIVDITLKDRSGLDFIRDARAQGCTAPALVLSMHDEATHAEKALRAGAQGYVMKENADEQIVGAIRAIRAGNLHVSEAIADRMLRQYLGEDEAAGEATGVESLTEREREIFGCMGRGMTTKDIADRLHLSARTVEVHRAHIKKKLGCQSAGQVLREAVRWVEGGN